MPALYRSPGSKLTEPGRTNYAVPLGKETHALPAWTEKDFYSRRSKTAPT